jgi:hypothetical protein
MKAVPIKATLYSQSQLKRRPCISLNSSRNREYLTDILHITMSPQRFHQITFASCPLNQMQQITQPALLHLVELLQAEMQTPQLASQIFVLGVGKLTDEFPI